MGAESGSVAGRVGSGRGGRRHPRNGLEEPTADRTQFTAGVQTRLTVAAGLLLTSVLIALAPGPLRNAWPEPAAGLGATERETTNHTEPATIIIRRNQKENTDAQAHAR